MDSPGRLVIIFSSYIFGWLYSNSDDPHGDPFGRGCEEGAKNDDDKGADGDEGHDYYLQVGPPLFGLLVLGRSAECRVGRQYLAQVYRLQRPLSCC